MPDVQVVYEPPRVIGESGFSGHVTVRLLDKDGKQVGQTDSGVKRNIAIREEQKY